MKGIVAQYDRTNISQNSFAVRPVEGWNGANYRTLPGSVEDPWHFGTDPEMRTLWLTDPDMAKDPAIFVRWPSRRQQNILFFQIFFILLFEGTLPSFFKDKSHKEVSRKTVRIKDFLTIFAWW